MCSLTPTECVLFPGDTRGEQDAEAPAAPIECVLLSLQNVFSFQVTQEANKTQKPPPGRPRLEAHHVHSALPGYVQLMHDCWAQVPHDRPPTDQCVMQVLSYRMCSFIPIECVGLPMIARARTSA